MPTYPPVESVTRALQLLCRLNHQDITSVTELHRITRLPKPSLVRLLDTLISMGYVQNDTASKGYRLAPAVQALSAGFHHGPLLAEAGGACIAELTRRLKWTVSIAVLDGAGMFIACTTLRDSPCSPFGTMLARRRDLLVQGIGRAYLAFCPEAERSILVTMLKDGADAERCQAIDATVAEIVAKGARQGYIERDPTSPPNQTSTVGVPILADGRILGTIGMTYFSSAVARNDVAQLIAAPLRETALAVGKNAERLLKQQRSARNPHLWGGPRLSSVVPRVRPDAEWDMSMVN
jgi:IclR family mhp operon transcriptional activator